VAEVKFNDTEAGGQAPSPGAAAYASSRLGYRVFPLVPGSGTPALKEYPDLATTDTEVIQEWWSGEFAGYGVGIATGEASGIWVLDIDMKKGVDGFASLLDLRLKYRDYDIDRYTRTMVVTTPSGGAHIYFRWAEGVVNSVGRLGKGLDVRAERGYVRGPGWGGYAVVPRGPEGERVVRLLAAPEWLTGLAQKRRHEREGDAMSREEPGTSWARFSAGKTLETLGRAPEGGRNDALNKAAYKLGRSGAVEMGDAWASCKAIMARIGAGDAVEAQRRTFESGWNAGVAARSGA
jgi:hypothetical protein